MAHNSENLEHQNPIKSHHPMVYPHFSIFFHQKLQIWGRHPSPFYPFWANPIGALAGCTVTSIEASGWRCPGGIADEWLEDSLCWLPLRSFEILWRPQDGALETQAETCLGPNSGSLAVHMKIPGETNPSGIVTVRIFGWIVFSATAKHQFVCFQNGSNWGLRKIPDLDM